MYITLLNNDQYKDIWNRFVCSRGGSYFQFWQWGDFEKIKGKEVYRLAVFNRNDSGRDIFVAALSASLEKRSFGKSIITVSRGPVMDLFSAEHYKAIEFLFNYLSSVAKEKKAAFLRIDPPLLASDASFLGSYFSSLKEKLSGAKKRLAASGSYKADISFSEDEILANAPTRFSYNLKLAKERFEIKEIDIENGAESLESRMVSFEKNKKIRKEWIDFFRMIQQSSPSVLDYASAEERKTEQEEFKRFMLKVFFASEQGKDIAMAVVLNYADRAVSLFEKSLLKNDSMPLYLIHWRAALAAKKVGISAYEMEKEKTAIAGDLGGKLELMSDAYDIVYSKFWYRIVKSL